jgi:hypothetical protein
MNYLAIGLIIIIFIILYYVYYYITNNNLTAGLQPLKNQVSVTFDKMVNPNSLTYSYQCWLYIPNPPATKTSLFYKATSVGDPYPEFGVDINGQTLSISAGKGDVAPKQIMVITQKFPIQKWTYLVVNVTNTQTFEVYINGKLAKTVNVSSSESPVPISKMSTLYIGNGGLTGYVTRFVRLPSTIDAQTAWNNYLSGNGLNNMLSTLLPYGLNMSISKGEDVQRVITVF